MLTISESNPNETVGGGGCLCHPIKSTDTRGPFVIFPQSEMESNLSPHCVLCVDCLCEANAKMVAAMEAGDMLNSGHADEVTPVEEIEV